MQENVMTLIYLAVSCIAALAVSMSVYGDTGSLLLSVIAYSATGTLVLLGVLLTAALRERADEADHAGAALYPAE
jgi:uncharacterized membrane protein